MTNPKILIVEDNQILRRQLNTLLTNEGLSCILAKNENEAMENFSKDIQAVVADIELSEAGGGAEGGIELAKRLAVEEWDTPVFLISQTPNKHVSPGSERYSEITQNCHIIEIMDRTKEDFRKNLVKKLKKILRK